MQSELLLTILSFHPVLSILPRLEKMDRNFSSYWCFLLLWRTSRFKTSLLRRSSWCPDLRFQWSNAICQNSNYDKGFKIFSVPEYDLWIVLVILGRRIVLKILCRRNAKICSDLASLFIVHHGVASPSTYTGTWFDYTYSAYEIDWWTFFFFLFWPNCSFFTWTFAVTLPCG